jgi:preprotein translocase SecE subunit
MSDARPERHPAVGRQTQPVEERRRGHFVQESWAELRKVEWPNQNQVIQGTVVVRVACAIGGLYLWLNDQVWKHFVSKILLGQ